MHFPTTKKIIVILAILWGFLYALPNMLPDSARETLQAGPSWLPNKTVSLGLDLQGGSHLLMQVEMEPLIKERVDALADGAKAELRERQIKFSAPRIQQNGFIISLQDGADNDEAYRALRNLEDGLEVESLNDTDISVKYGLQGMTTIQDQTIAQSIEIIRRRVDETGTKEPVIQRQGTDRILIQLPGVDNPEEIKELIGKTAKLTFHLVDITATGRARGTMRLPMQEDPNQKMSIYRRSMVTGEMLTNAQPAFDQNGSPVVSFALNAIGAKRFCDVTSENIDKPFAIVLDNEVISAPRILSRICGGRGQISGGFSVEEANNLAILLRAGALPAPLKVVEERSVGPSLGADSVAAGKMASIVGIVLVLLYMLFSYGLFGVFANIALIVNMALIFAILSVIQATLTLPGIAGIVLTIGMAVDANVLIFERIREEFALGRSVVASIDAGYKQAFSTIVDANITTLIAALLLFSFGSGPIKGFAVTLGIGILTSMFSAILLTRFLTVTWLNRKHPKTLPI